MKFETSNYRNQRGSAVLVIIILLGIITIYVSSNAVALSVLKRDLQIIESRQAARNHATITTNQSIKVEPLSHGKNTND